MFQYDDEMFLFAVPQMNCCLKCLNFYVDKLLHIFFMQLERSTVKIKFGLLSYALSP